MSFFPIDLAQSLCYYAVNCDRVGQTSPGLIFEPRALELEDDRVIKTHIHTLRGLADGAVLAMGVLAAVLQAIELAI
jgi:hypothetical protein